MEHVGESIAGLRDEDIWSLRTRECARLVDITRRRLHRQLAQRGVTGDDLAVAEKVLDPEALTLGFARRFAAYKRPNLLLSDPERLKRLLTDPARPVQIVIAGKAHPSDDQGKQFIAAWVQFAEDPDVRRRVAFIEDYDMTLAADLVQGVDVWLNTPRRPWEACGTSGMKVLVNGGLNLSELDGWWVEAYASDTGWALTNGQDLSERERDAAEARSLYRLLESEVVPLYYDRDARGLPRGWINRIRSSMSELTPRFSSNRMLREYVENAYVPAASDVHARSADGARLARDLAAWDTQVEDAWPTVRFTDVTRREEDGAVHVTATIEPGGLSPDHIRVELVADAIGPMPPVCEPMRREEMGDDGPVSYTITLRTDRPAGHFTPRAVPNHPSAHVPIECPRIRWPE
jgi:starch phosphorylase